MKLEHHIAISTLVSSILYLTFKSWGLAVASFFSGILIDIDHIFDYFIEHRLHFDLRKFLHFFYKEKHRKITLIFHGWEWLLCLGVTTVLTGFNPWITGFFIGYGHHITSDYLYSKANMKSYSLLWRLKQNFDSDKIFPRNRGYNP